MDGMDVAVFVDSIIDVQDQIDATSCNEETQQSSFCADFKTQSDTAEKHSAVWTSSATSTLLKLYESKLEMLETPKRKKRIWLAISESLKEHQIAVSPDQVRWKINALTKKYKRCVDTGANEKFKYFREMDKIYSKYNIDTYGYTVSEILDSKTYNHRNTPNKNGSARSESKAIIELRKMRLANRLEADRSQTKIHIEKQWLDYLNRQDQMRIQRDEITDMHLKIKEQELELKKKELELKSLELVNMHLKEQELNEFLLAEREKCELLKQLFC